VHNIPAKGQRKWRGMLLVPWVIPGAMSTLAWQWLFDPSYSAFCWPAEHPPLLPDGIKVPFAGDPFQRFSPVITKPQSRARNQILNGARHKHFTRAGERRDPCASMHCDPADLAAH
jgi:hypothetical protein